MRLNRYRVTFGGVLFLIALTLTGAAAFFSGNNLLFLIFAAMMALLLVSGFLSRLVLAGLELEFLLPEHVSARSPAPARVRLRNLKRLTPSFSIELSSQTLTSPVYFPVIPGRAAIEAAVEVVFPRRGRHGENLFVISTKFPFGFMRKSATVALRRDTIVYPSLEPHPHMEILLNSLAGEIDKPVRGDGRDFYRIRLYEARDDARHVDWKSTAHTGALQVREFTLDRQRTVEILFDRNIAPGQRQIFEEMVERCAFLAWELSRADRDIWFRSQDFSLSVPDDGEVYDILRFLALTEPITIVPVNDQPTEFTSDDSHPQIVFSISDTNSCRNSSRGAG